VFHSKIHDTKLEEGAELSEKETEKDREKTGRKKVRERAMTPAPYAEQACVKTV